MLFTLRPLVLESQGLGAALKQLAEKIHETHGQEVATRVAPDAESALDKHQQGVIFYIAEEAVNNARKHAHAPIINVAVARQGDVVVVQISDNGVGFNIDSVDANYDQRGSLGMVNMRERAALVDGTLHIESAEGKGTTITVIVPLKNVAATMTYEPGTKSRKPLTKLAATAINSRAKS
jgi:signal transduction histidine kinase